jgi:hypothetical protein
VHFEFLRLGTQAGRNEYQQQDKEKSTRCHGFARSSALARADAAA